MIGTLPRWLHRASALALLLLACGAVYAGVVGPVVAAYGETRERLAGQRELLSRYLAIAEGREALERQVQELRRRQASSGAFITGKTEALATAAVQDRVRSAMQRAGGDVRSMQSLPAKDEEGLTRVGLRVQVVATIRNVKEILHDLESGRPLLFVEELEMRGRLQRGQDNEPTVSDLLLVKLTVAGYRLGEES